MTIINQTDDEPHSSSSMPTTSIVAQPITLSSVTTVNSFRSQLIQVLDIPANLTSSGDVTLQLAYKKYKAFLVASHTVSEMVGNGTWEIKRPTKADLIEIFVSKSFFHSHYQRCFTKAAGYPDMLAWLEEVTEEDDIDIWGYSKVTYTFTDLKAWLANGGPIEPEESDGYEKVAKHMKKGKGKGKEMERAKGKEKEKEKEEKGKKREHKKKSKKAQ
jgi:hypothetical protein